MKKTLLILMVVVMLMTSVVALPVAAAGYRDTEEAIALKEAVDEANAIYEKALAFEVVYFKEAWDSFEAVLKSANGMYNDHNFGSFSADDINAMTESLVLAMADLENNKGAEVSSGAELTTYAKYEGTFIIKNDIKLTATIENFKGDIVGGGYTVTLSNCGMFSAFAGSVSDLTIEGTTGGAKSLLGKATGDADVSRVIVKVDALTNAVLFDAAEDEAVITVEDVVASGAAPALVAADADIYNAYLENVEYFDGNANKRSAAEIAAGLAAYNVNNAFGEIVLVQKLGKDSYPVIGNIAADRSNVVVWDSENSKFKNDATYVYDDPNGIEINKPAGEIVVPVTKDYLAEAIKLAKELKADDYEEITWELFQTALAQAEEIYNDANATQATVDLISSTLPIRMAGLKQKVVESAPEAVDFTGLDKAISDAQAYTKDKYTEASWANFKAAMAMAEVAKTATTQGAVNSAKVALESAMKGLVVEKAEPAVEDENQATEPAVEEGCGSVIGGSAVAIAAVLTLGACVSFKKKEN